MTRPDVPRGKCPRCGGSAIAARRYGDEVIIVDCPDCHGTGLQPLMSRAWSKATGSCRELLRVLGRVGK